VAAHPVIVSERGCAYRAHIEDRFAAAGLTLDLRGEVGGTAAAVAAVRAGLGVALLPAAGLTATAPAAPPAPAAPAAPPAPAGSSPPPEGTVLRAVADVDLALPLGLVRPRAGEPHSALTSEAIAAVRAAAPAWRS
jgi:DNA-binding transcriptional LysR family regulator